MLPPQRPVRGLLGGAPGGLTSTSMSRTPTSSTASGCFAITASSTRVGARRRGVATPSATIRSAITGGTIEDVEVSAPCLNVAWAGACERCYCCPRACRVCQLAFRRTSSIPLQNFVGHTVAVNDDCTVQTVAYTSSLFTGSSRRHHPGDESQWRRSIFRGLRHELSGPSDDLRCDHPNHQDGGGRPVARRRRLP